MAAGQLQHLLHHLGRYLGDRSGAALPDQVLLERFVRARDQDAFAALVERHGGMVLAVCRRVLRHGADAEDACQATFLVLARKAGAIRRRGSVASWLHGVAYRTSRKLLASARRRRAADLPAEGVPQPDTSVAVDWREIREVLDREVTGLPDAYRAPLVLCYFEGLTQDEAARQLGWPSGVLRGRLDRGRERLRVRLARRGLAPGAAVFAPHLAGEGPAAMSSALASSAAQGAVLAGAGPTSVLSAGVTALAEGVVYEMLWFTRLKVAAILLAALVVVGGGTAAYRTWAAAYAEGHPMA